MRKVKNQKAIRDLAAKNYRANKTRNRIAILAIALTTMLFCTLFTIGMGVIDNFQRQTMRQVGGDSHGGFKNLSQEQYEKLRKDPSIKDYAPNILVADQITNPEFLKRHVEPWYYPESHYSHSFKKIIDGKAPTQADEILLDETSLKLLGKEAKSGQKVTLQMQLKKSSDTIISRSFVVSGVLQADPALNIGFAVVSESYLHEYADELTYTYPEDYSETGAIQLEVYFNNSYSIQEKLNKIIENAGYSIDESSSNHIESNANWAYVSDGTSADPATMGAIIGGLLLIILTGYLIIYNVFQIAVIRDIRYYGLLKTIGLTGKQIKKIIRWQAFRMELLGIPLGLTTGYILGCLLIPIVLSSTTLVGEVTITTNPLIFLGAALFSLFTVWFSTGKPARKAAKVSPIEAVRYTEQGSHQKKQKKSADGGKIHGMAFSNLGRSKIKTTLVILSLSLAIVLLNSLFTITHSFDIDKFLSNFINSDYIIGNAQYFNSNYHPSKEDLKEQALTESFVQACEQLEGFESGGKLYGSVVDIGLDKRSWTPPDYIPQDDEGNCGSYRNGEFTPYNMVGGESSHYMVNLYGMEDFYYPMLEVVKGEKDPASIKKKLGTGNYLICTVGTEDNGTVIENTVKHQPGDKITLAYGDNQTKEFEILSLVKENTYTLGNRTAPDFTYYTTADMFKEMVSDQHLMIYSFDVQNEQETAISNFLKDYTTTQEPLMNYESKQTWLDEFNGLIGLFVMVGGILALVMGIVGILNFINAILTGIVTRLREFAMLEAIGMSKKQLRRMLVIEGIYYSAFTIGVSFILGCLFSQTVIKSLSEGMWFMSYQFLFWPMLILYPILLALGIIIPWLAYLPRKQLSMIEQLRASE